jgi:pimeloyl-ACP methyl ester carboxylesterase
VFERERASIAAVWLILLLLLVPLAASADGLVQHTVEIDGHPMAVWEKSPARPRAVMLLVHGRTWSIRPDFDLQVQGEEKSLMDGLVALGIAAYGVDLRGYGATPRDGSGWLTPDRAAADVAGVLDWVASRNPALPAPSLFGWSYGAMVSQLAAQRYPDRLSALVLFGYPVRPGFDVSPEGSAGDPPRRPTTAAAAAEDFIVPGSINPEAIEAFVSQALAADPVRADWRHLEQWRRLDPAAVRVPTLLLQAEHDPLARADEHARLFTGLATPDRLWVVIPGGDHAAFMESPRPYFLSLIGAFLLSR